MEQLKLPIETSKDKAVTEFISRPFKGSIIKVYLISESESIRRRKSGIEGGSDEYCFCKCVGITVDYNRDEPREIALNCNIKQQNNGRIYRQTNERDREILSDNRCV
jgi:hypothetical protein